MTQCCSPGLKESGYLDLAQAVSAGTFIYIGAGGFMLSTTCVPTTTTGVAGGSHLTSEMKGQCSVVSIAAQVLVFLVGLSFMGTLALWV
jgi:hypothetical protein